MVGSRRASVIASGRFSPWCARDAWTSGSSCSSRADAGGPRERRRQPRARSRGSTKSLGGLARWLRAAGYEAALAPDVPGHRLPDEARRRGLVLLTTDAETLERRMVVDGSLIVVWVPSALTLHEQLGMVVRDLGLVRREPRCMACGGALVATSKEAVYPRIPPRTARWKDEYFLCATCDRLFWQGTHWERIAKALEAAVRP